MNVFIYVRVSTKEQLEGYSIDEQKERLKVYAKSKDFNVLNTYVDGGHSGATLDRPALQKMLDNISKTDAVLVYRLDRLSRSQKDTLHLIEDVFLKNDVEFISLSESFDTSTPFGRASIGILSVFAQLEREQIAERMTTGRVARAKDGYYHGGHYAPTGYDYTDGELVINEYEAECVRYIFNEYLKGRGYDNIYNSIQSKFPGVIQDRSTVSKILKRPLYKGYVTFEGKTYKGRHKPIVDDKTFDAVQKINSKRSSRFRSNTLYLLSGLLYCGHCNARLAGHAGKKLKNGNQLRYYVCYSRKGYPKNMTTQPNCDKKFERKEDLEQKIINEVKKLKLSDVTVKNDNSDRIKKLEKELDKIDDQLSKAVELYSLGNIPIDIIKNKVDDLNTKKEALEKRIESLMSESDNIKDVVNVIPTLKDIDKWDKEKQQVIIMTLIDRITVYNDRIVIDWMF